MWRKLFAAKFTIPGDSNDDDIWESLHNEMEERHADIQEQCVAIAWCTALQTALVASERIPLATVGRVLGYIRQRELVEQSLLVRVLLLAFRVDAVPA